MTLKFMRMRRAHLAECARIYAEVFSSPPWNGKWTVQTSSTHLHNCFRMAKFHGMVARKRNQIIGFAFGLFQQWENERHFYLKEMCVRATEQGGGVGTRLLNRLVTQLRTKGVSQISLGTGRDPPAAKFYERLGFETDRKTIIMNKRLPKSRPSAPRRLRECSS